MGERRSRSAASFIATLLLLAVMVGFAGCAVAPYNPAPSEGGSDPSTPASGEGSGEDPESPEPSSPGTESPGEHTSSPGTESTGEPNRFPDESTTGVPSGTSLRAAGSVSVTEPGTVIEGLEVLGAIDVYADNVTIRNSRISTGEHRYPIHVHPGVVGLLIEYVEVSNELHPGKGIFFDRASGTVRHANIHSSEDGVFITGDEVTIEASYIHHLVATPTSHNDSIQIRRGNNITIRDNNLQVYNDLTDDPMNAAIQIGTLVGDDPIKGLNVVGNLMNGGNMTVNLGRATDIEEAVFRNNQLGRDFRYGVVGNLSSGVIWDASNVYADTGEPAP